MPLMYRRFLSCVLLTIFVSVAVLGEGLHWLTPETEQHHHHCHGLCTYSHESHRANDDSQDEHFTSHSHACADGAVCEFALSTKQAVVRENHVDAHVCKICAYLFQIVSEPIDMSAPLEWQPLVVFVPNLRTFIYSSSALRSHAPRGPPVLA